MSTPDVAAEIEDHLAGQATASEGFTVTDLTSANWAARKLAQIDRKERELEAAVNAQIDELERYRAERKAVLAGDRDYFTALLLRWHRNLVEAELADGTKPDRVTKTVKLIGGVEITRRAAGQSLKIVDLDALVAHVKTTGEALATQVTTWKPETDTIKKNLLAGQPVPGARLQPTAGADPDGFLWNVTVKPKGEDQ